MIELLLGAERALAAGLVDQAERLYRQAADGDPHNSIAVVGLARVALERGDEPEAWRLARRALGIDPENVAAQRLAGRLEEIWAYRGESLPEAAGAVEATKRAAEPKADVQAVAEPGPGSSPEPGPGPSPGPSGNRAAEHDSARAEEPGPPPTPATSRRSVVDRLLRRRRP
jgi:tetratricopeptide (TPR) repeat protein